MRYSTFLTLAFILLISCDSRHGKKHLTQHNVNMVTRSMEYCEGGIDDDPALLECVREYLEEIGHPVRAAEPLLRDGNDVPIIFNNTEACRSVQSIIPYSVGENRVDECGFGDDITASKW